MEIGELGGSGPGLDAMNVQTNELTRTAQGVSSCGFCSQPLFGPVAYCPYCGKANLATTVRPPEDRPEHEKFIADGQESRGMPGGARPASSRPPSRAGAGSPPRPP